MGKVLVIGGGAAGMMAAGRAAQRGHEVSLYEKNALLGKKIYITGKGRCNITNAGDVEDFIENIPGNPYFLYSALYSFSSSDTIAFFESLGLPTKVERGRRVFPVSDKAADVVKALEKFLKKNKVKIHLGCAAEEILMEEKEGVSTAVGIRLANGQSIGADGIIVTCGGLSYPGTGSTGDGYKFAKAAGHTVTPLTPGLVPLRCREEFCKELMGVSLKNVAAQFLNEDKKVLYKDFGEMLFTHYGVSGPIILSASSHLTAKERQNCILKLDLKPALTEKALDTRLLRDFEKYVNRDFKNALEDLLPQKMIPVIIGLSGIPETKKVHDITKAERKTLCSVLKSMTLSICGDTGFKEAVITRGGICVDELNPGTMESKKVKGLYFAGEVLDVDGYTGGYNLQIAFSTGWEAGEHILEEE